MEMILPKRNIGKMVLLIIAVIILWFGTFGLLYHMNDMEMDGHKSGCLFNGPTAICAMNYSEHIANWQNMFTSLPQNASPVNLLVLAAISIVLLFSWHNNLKLLENIASRWRLYAKSRPKIDIYNSIREAFSQGILNPKIYERAA